MISVLWFMLLLFTSVFEMCLAENSNNVFWEKKLFEDLMTDYNKYVKPTKNPNDCLDVSVQFMLARVESLDEKNQILTSFGGLSVTWDDESLSWHPSDYGNTYSIVLPGDQIWLPEIVLLNSMDQGMDLTLDTKFRVKILSNGRVNWLPTFKWVTSCKVDVFYLPFDDQFCEVQFINWMYGADMVNLTLQEIEPLITVYYSPNGEWKLLDHKVARKELAYYDQKANITFKQSAIGFRLHLGRLPSYLVVNIVMPAVVMTTMSVLVFCMPPESGEKISLGITVLLSYTVVNLMVSDITPRVSDSLPLISYYITLSMIQTALSLFLTMLVLCVHNTSPETPVPTWIGRLFLHGLAYLLCIARPQEGSTSTLQPVTVDRRQSAKQNTGVADPTDVKKIQDSVEALSYYIKLKDKENEKLEYNKMSWEAVARVIDRLFLVFSTLTSVTVTAMLFGFLGNKPFAIKSGYQNNALLVVDD